MQTLPHGSWPSALTARHVHGGRTRRGSARPDGDDVYWLEVRPDAGGRPVLVRQREDDCEVVSAPGHAVRTTLHEYGGGDYAVSDGLVLYVDQDSQRVWLLEGDEAPRPITTDTGATVRYGGFCIDSRRRVAWCTRENQRDDSLEPVTSLVRLDLDAQQDGDHVGEVVVAGRERPVDGEELAADAGSAPDFVLDPALSPDARRLAWISWNHPQMAWDGTYLWVADLDDEGVAHDIRQVAGSTEESIEQPLWRTPSELVCLSDRSGWSTLHTLDLLADEPTLRPVTEDEHDYGIPRWVPGQRAYDLLPDGRVISGCIVDGARGVRLVDLDTGATARLPLPISFCLELAAAADGTVVLTAQRPDQPVLLARLDPRSHSLEPLVENRDRLLARYAAPPEPISWRSWCGATAYGFLYRPTNPDVTAPAGEKPPLVVTTHGGPTAAAFPGASAERTFWTSRGFAVLDVNYAGSSGFGREYRGRLDGQWGVADVQDVASGARHLAEIGLVDPHRLLIRGGSAGGYLTLAALTGTGVFAAGTSLYGIGDLTTLVRDTHKLESRYTWSLVAPWPEGESTYLERSPIQHLDRLSAPMLLLQGGQDKVVPPEQAHAMAAALGERGIPHALVVFPEEGHGFRDPGNNVRAVELELSFYGQVLGFTPADDVEQVELVR